MSAVILVFIVCWVFLGLACLVQHYSRADDLQAKFTLLKNIGLVRKSLTYLNLYTYRIASRHPDFSYDRMVALEAERFYNYSALTYE